MDYFVTTGVIAKWVFGNSPEEAAINLLNVETGPFGVLVAVSENASLADACFFHTETLLEKKKFLNFKEEVV